MTSMTEVCALCPHERWMHVIGSEEDCDSPECGPHDSFCIECDEDEEDHEFDARQKVEAQHDA